MFYQGLKIILSWYVKLGQFFFGSDKKMPSVKYHPSWDTINNNSYHAANANYFFNFTEIQDQFYLLPSPHSMKQLPFMEVRGINTILSIKVLIHRDRLLLK